MGILLDSRTMDVRLSEDKLTQTFPLPVVPEQISYSLGTSIPNRHHPIHMQGYCPSSRFLQCIIQLTKSIQLPHWHIKLNACFRKEIKMSVEFLEHWNRVSIFLDSHLSSPMNSIYSLMLPGP